MQCTYTSDTLIRLARALTRGEPGCVRAQAEFGEEAFAAQRARADADRRAAKEAAAAGAADANAIPLGQRVRPVWERRIEMFWILVTCSPALVLF